MLTADVCMLIFGGAGEPDIGLMLMLLGGCTSSLDAVVSCLSLCP